ncbi:MAG: lipopolysaccharide biosynthesis protein [Pseudomonadota bacterium]
MDASIRGSALDSEQAPLGAQVVKGAAWVVAGRCVVRALGLINTIILARLLTPADFGIVALGVVVMQLFQNVSDIGVANAVVRLRKADRAHYDTLFSLSMARGVAIAVLMLAGSFAADLFYDDPRVANIFLALTPAPIMAALVNPRFYDYERHFDFAKEFWLAAAHKLVGVSVSIAIAVIFRTYWAIVIGLVAGAATQTALSWAVRPYRPRLTFSALSELGGFAGWYGGLSVFAALNNKLDILILGKILSPAALGAFFVGGSLAAIPREELAAPVARAVYPGFASLQNDPAALKEGYLKSVEALALFIMPIAFGAAFIAEDAVAIILGAQWIETALLLQILGPAVGVGLLFAATNAYATAIGNVRAICVREIVLFFIRTPLFIGLSIAFGFAGAAAAAAASILLHAGLNVSVFSRLSGASVAAPFARARRSFYGVAAMTAYFLWPYVDIGALAQGPAPLRLLIDIGIGASVFFGAVFAAWRIEGRPDGIEVVIGRRVDRIISHSRRLRFTQS